MDYTYKVKKMRRNNASWKVRPPVNFNALKTMKKWDKISALKNLLDEKIKLYAWKGEQFYDKLEKAQNDSKNKLSASKAIIFIIYNLILVINFIFIRFIFMNLINY